MKEKFFCFFKKNKKYLLGIAAVLLCMTLGLGGWLIFGNRDTDPADNGVTEKGGYDENISVEDAIKKGYFPAHVLNELSKPANDNKLPDSSSKKVLAEKRIRYEMTTGDFIKVIVVDDVKLATDDFDTMTVRIRSLTEDNFTRWRLYLKTTSKAELANSEDCCAFDSRGMHKEAFRATEPDKDGWITLTIELNQLEMWNDARNIRGFSLGVEHKGAMFEIQDIRFTNEGRSSSAGQTTISGSVEEGIFTAELLDDVSYHTWNFLGTDSTSSRELTDTGIRYKTTRNESAAIKAVVVRNIEMNPAKFNTMTVKIRSISMREFTRWRFYLLTDKGGSITVSSEYIADTANTYTDAFEFSEADKDGWITVTIDVGSMKEWQEASVVKAFGLGYVNTGNTIEIESIKFTYVTEPAPVTVTDGNFTPAILNTNSEEDCNFEEKNYSAKEVRSTGMRYTVAKANEGRSAVKVIQVTSANMKTADFDTLTVKIRSLDGKEFKRWRLYLGTDAGSKVENGKHVLDSTSTNADLAKATGADSNGWITVTFDLSGLKAWTGATKLTSFGLGYVNTGNKIEVASMKFTKEKAAAPKPVTVTDGNFTPAILNTNSQEDCDFEGKNYSVEEVLSTGIKYTVASANEGRSAIKVIQVTSADMKTADYNTLTVKVRSLDNTSFSRWRLYLGTDAGSTVENGKHVLDSTSTNAGLVSATKADADGWITVTFDLSGLSEWTNATKLTSFGLGYVNTGNRIEVASMKFTKSVAEEKPSPSVTVVTDGNFTPAILNTNSEEDCGFAKGNYSAKEVLSTGIKYTVASANEGRGAIKVVEVQSVDMKTADFDIMTMKIRSLDNVAFSRWRLYLGTDAGSTVADGKQVLDSSNLNANLIEVSAADADGWITVTISLNGLSAWAQAEKLTSFGVGYVNKGNNIEIESIKFTSNGLSDDAETEIANGNFPADVLVMAGKPIKDNNTSDATSTQALANGVVAYNFGESLALKSVYVSSLNLVASDYGSMVVKLRSATEFERFRLYLTTNKGGSLVSSPVVDTAKGLNANLVTVSAPDADNWITVTIKVSQLDAWKTATTVSGFSFGFVNEGATQEISEIRFTKKSGSFTAQALSAYGTALYGNSALAEIQKTLNSESVTYTFGATQTTGLKSICVENLEINTTTNNKLSLRIRSLEGKAFTNYRLYLLTSAGGALSANEVIDLAAAKNAAALTVSEPDADGWITVEIALSDLSEWTGTLQGFNFAWENEGTTFEVADVAFSYVATAPVNSLTFTPEMLNTVSDELYDNNGNKLSTKSLLSTGLKYVAYDTKGAIRVVRVTPTESIETADYDTLTVKIRSLDNKAFTRWRLYLATDLAGGSNTSGALVMDSTNQNASLIDVSAPDADGWITVTYDLSGLSAWTDATTMTKIGIGYVNSGNKNIEIASMEFTK